MPRATSVNPVDSYVGARVRALRDKHRMSQEKLAAPLGLTFQQVQKYERGTNRISASRLAHIAQIFGVTPAHFFEGAPGATRLTSKKEATSSAYPAAAVAKFMTSDEGQALAKAFARINDPKVRRAVVRMAETLARD
jgi:transcriptional regulator with XRE-family HTH domain